LRMQTTTEYTAFQLLRVNTKELIIREN